ncbi:MAG TPA: cysteine hydrolase [bacterium]|nr:cysteine hydrolase [bacterium]HEX68215.1 cysteine hydrolase [bacterium]
MRALLVIDMLKDFLEEGKPLFVKKGREIIGNIKKRIEEARKEGIPVIYICDSHLPEDMEMKIWPPHALRGTEGAEVVEELKPQKDDYVILKRRYSGFLGTELDLLLRELGIKEVVITGVLTNICVLFTAGDAFMRGYKVIIPEDSVASVSEEDHKFALKLMKEVLKAEVI